MIHADVNSGKIKIKGDDATIVTELLVLATGVYDCFYKREPQLAKNYAELITNELKDRFIENPRVPKPKLELFNLELSTCKSECEVRKLVDTIKDIVSPSELKRVAEQALAMWREESGKQ